MLLNNLQVVVIGAGTRVTRDILPVLSAAGFNHEAINIVRIKNEPLRDYKTFDNLDKLPSSSKNSNTIFIICVPPNITEEIIEKIFRECTPLMILIDTPIASYNFYKQLRSLEKSDKIRIGVLEDVSTIPFFFNATRQQIQKQNSFFRVLYLNNFLFRYHQVAFINKLDLGYLFLAFKIRKWNFAVCGSKKYGISFFLSVFGNDQLGQNLISLYPKFDLSPNTDLNLLFEKRESRELLKKLEIDRSCLINRPYEDNFQNWKKIGLYYGFKAASENQNVFPTVSEQFRNQILSGWRYNPSFLKRLLKRILFFTRV